MPRDTSVLFEGLLSLLDMPLFLWRILPQRSLTPYRVFLWQSIRYDDLQKQQYYPWKCFLTMLVHKMPVHLLTEVMGQDQHMISPCKLCMQCLTIAPIEEHAFTGKTRSRVLYKLRVPAKDKSCWRAL